MVRFVCASLAIFSLMATDALAEDFFPANARPAARAEVARLKGIQAGAEAAILEKPGVLSVGIGLDKATGKLAFKVTVDEALPLPPLPRKLQGVPVLVERDTPQSAANGGAACVPCHANQTTLPAQMGNSGRPVAAGSTCGACTMGFKACELQTGDAVWVTSAHCATDATRCPGTAPVGTQAFHVAPLDALTCSAVTSAVGLISQQVAPVANGTVDAVSIDSDATLTQVAIRDIGVPAPTAGDPLPGDTVQKSGRTTGYTTGTVDSINVSVNVTYNCGTLLMTQQVRIDVPAPGVFCQGGDSGSGVFDMEDPPQLVGLIMSSNGAGTRCYANHVDNVLAQLGLSMSHTECFADSCIALLMADETNDPAGATSSLYQLRDEVLGSTEPGKNWIRTFYEVSPAWIALYTSHPQLFVTTRNAFEANRFVLDAVAARQPVTITAQRLAQMTSLINQHIEVAQDQGLEDAFIMWRDAINNPQVQQYFNVTVQ